MFDVNHLCPGCMGKWEDAENPCPHCGFTWEKTDMDLRLIPAFSIIGGRYLLGRGIGAGGFGLIYMAMDLVKETPVAVKEFFPAEMAKREGEQVSPASPEWERGFREALRGFRKEGNALSKAHDIDGIVGFRDFLEENGTCYLVMPSLVAVSHQSAQELATWFGQGLMYENQNCSSGVILAQTEDEILIVTSNHTIDGAQTLSVGFDDGTTAEAFIKGTDLEHDIAVIGVSLADLSSDTASHISLIQPGSSADLQIDEQVVAVGSELGNGQFMTTGKIKMLNCSMPVDGSPNTLIQTNAAVIPGNAGGALLNMSGQLTGIISARYSETAEDGTSCAIPVDDLYSIVNNLP